MDLNEVKSLLLNSRRYREAALNSDLIQCRLIPPYPLLGKNNRLTLHQLESPPLVETWWRLDSRRSEKGRRGVSLSLFPVLPSSSCRFFRLWPIFRQIEELVRVQDLPFSTSLSGRDSEPCVAFFEYVCRCYPRGRPLPRAHVACFKACTPRRRLSGGDTVNINTRPQPLGRRRSYRLVLPFQLPLLPQPPIRADCSFARPESLLLPLCRRWPRSVRPRRKCTHLARFAYPAYPLNPSPHPPSRSSSADLSYDSAAPTVHCATRYGEMSASISGFSPVIRERNDRVR